MENVGIDLVFISFAIICILLSGNWLALFGWIGSMFVDNLQTLKLDTIAPCSLEILEMISIISVWITIKRQNLVGSHYTDPTKRLLISVKISFIWIFGLFNLTTQLFNIFIASACFRFGRSLTIILVLSYVITQFVSLVTGMVFLTIHRSVILKPSRIVKCSLAIYVLTTAFIWYKSFVKKLSGTYFVPEKFGRNQSSNSMNGFTCYWNHPAQAIFGPLVKLWAPTYVQYFLLLVTFVIQIWPKNDIYFRSHSLRQESLVRDQNRQNERIKRKQVIAIASIIILLFRLPTLVNRIFIKASKTSSKTERIIHDLETPISSLIRRIVMTISLVVCFHLMEVRSVDYKQRSRKAKDIIIIFGAMGFLAHLTFSTFMSDDIRKSQILLALNMFLEVYTIFLQTIFIIRGNKQYGIEKILIWSIFVSMVMMENFMSWIEGAFLTSLSHTNHHPDTVGHALLAIALSYNFYSFLELVKILIQS